MRPMNWTILTTLVPIFEICSAARASYHQGIPLIHVKNKGECTPSSHKPKTKQPATVYLCNRSQLSLPSCTYLSAPQEPSMLLKNPFINNNNIVWSWLFRCGCPEAKPSLKFPVHQTPPIRYCACVYKIYKPLTLLTRSHNYSIKTQPLPTW